MALHALRSGERLEASQFRVVESMAGNRDLLAVEVDIDSLDAGDTTEDDYLEQLEAAAALDLYAQAATLSIAENTPTPPEGATDLPGCQAEALAVPAADRWSFHFGGRLQVLDHVLAPGGRVALQAITMPHDRMLATRDTHTFITKYVFPGGSLPSVQAIEETARRHTLLRVVDQLSLGADYAATLQFWDDAFTAAAAEIGRAHV